MYLNFRVCFFRAGSTYLFTLVAVKKQIAMLLNTLHFKDCRGSIYNKCPHCRPHDTHCQEMGVHFLNNIQFNMQTFQQ